MSAVRQNRTHESTATGLSKAAVRVVLVLCAVAAVSIGFAEAMSLRTTTIDSLSFDGFRYLAAAESLLRSGNYLDISGKPLTTWPPGTSLLYAAASRISGSEPEALTFVIGAASYLAIATAVLSTLIFSISRWWLAVLAFSTLALNTFLVSSTTRLLSDLPALAVLSSLIALVIAGLTKRRVSYVIAAAALLSLAVLFRFAMFAALPLVAIAGVFITRRLAGILPALLVPVPLAALMRVLAAGGHTTSPFALAPIPLRDDWNGLATLSWQIIPSKAGSTATVGLAICLFLVVLPALRRSATVSNSCTATLAVHIAWLISYGGFLVAAQAISGHPFQIDLRVLFPMYPSIIIVLATASDELLGQGKRIAGGLAIALLLLAVVRALHPVLVQRQPEPVGACVSRAEIVRSIRRLAPHIRGNVASNAQGLTWFALRRNVQRPQDTPPDSLLVYVDPRGACQFTVEDPTRIDARMPVLASDGIVSIVERASADRTEVNAFP